MDISARGSGLRLGKIQPRYSRHIPSAKCDDRPISFYMSREYRVHHAKYALWRIMTSGFNISDVWM